MGAGIELQDLSLTVDLTAGHYLARPNGPQRAARSVKHKISPDKLVPVVVTMRVACGCGHAEDETYEIDVPATNAEPTEGYEPGTCPKCRAPIRIYLKRVNALQ